MEQQRAATGRAPGRRSSTASTRRQPARRRPVQRRPPVRRPRRGDSKRRLLFVLAFTMVAFLAISGRLIVLQVLDAPSLDEAAAKQRLRTIELPGERGRIFDRDGGDLALSVPARTVYAQPRLIGDPAGTARKLAPLLGQPAKTVLGRRSEERRVWKECRFRWSPDHQKKKSRWQANSARCPRSPSPSRSVCRSWASERFFFFQAEDGIRAFHVTGVQTCALPISWRVSLLGGLLAVAAAHPTASS